MRKVISVLSLVAVTGCAAQAAPSRIGEPASDPAPVLASSPKAPMTVEWIVQGESGNRMTLVARVNRHAPMRVPTAVTVTGTPGMKVVSGRTSWIIEPSDSSTPVEETLVVEVVRGGPQELLLAADAEGTGFGVHAKKAFSVGKEPERAAPQPTGPHLEVGGRDFGPSVPAQP